MPQDDGRRLLQEALGPMHMLMLRAEGAYRAYLADGRKFIHTQVLRDSNEKLRNLLLEKGYLLPEERQADALALVAHLDVWLLRWYDTRDALRPSLDEPFVFENDHVYPREAAQRLKELYASLAGRDAAEG